MGDWSTLPAQLPVFLLVTIRVGALLVVAPGFASRSLPPAVRLWLSLFVALLILPAAGRGITAPMDLWSTALGAGREVAVGILFGLAVQVILMAASYGGRLAGAQMGFGFGGVIDPTGEEQQTLLDTFQEMLALVLFLSLGAHRVLLGALARSFELVPVGQGVVSGRVLQEFTTLFGTAMAVALEIAAPVVACVTLAELAIGLVSRSVPSFNLFSVGFAIRIAVGLIVFALAAPVSVLLVQGAIGTLGSALDALTRGLAP